MHRVIRVLVFAPDANSALDAAHEVVHEKLKTVDDGGPFDYYVDFTDSPKMDPHALIEEKINELTSKKEGIEIMVGGSGKDRYGPIPPVLQVCTVRFPTDDRKGWEQVGLAFNSIRGEFKDNMTSIRHLLAKYSDDELFEEVPVEGKVETDGEQLYKDARMFKYSCEIVSGQAREGYLYDHLGKSITSIGHFEMMLNDRDEHPFYKDESGGQDPEWGPHIWNQPLWVVPFDVHY